MPDRLPIYDIEAELVARLRDGRRLIVSSPTGSGKSTQVPQMLLRHGFLERGQAVILQPRRIAARLLAARVAQEQGVPLGHEVGYQIRFENVTSAQTRIRYVTEGVLLRQMIDDPKLAGVSALLFDEFHERHLYGDITLARALDVQERDRPDLLILVMSATLDAELLGKYMNATTTTLGRPHHPALSPDGGEGGRRPGEGEVHEASRSAMGRGPVTRSFSCTTLSSEGRVHPVDIQYAAEPGYLDKRPVWDQAAEEFSRYVGSGGEGDVLVFMPGGYEISQTINAIRHTSESKGFLLLPLHGELPPREQDAAVARYPQRKVVVATNVAETSLTIDGIRLVIDSGLARIPRYDPYRGINTLLIEKISRAAADQRAGRAGRTAPGVCARLWSEREHQDRAAQELPEVRRLDLAEVVLTLKAAGVADLRRFRWLEPPEEQALAHAEELLLDLGALQAAPRADSSLSPAASGGEGRVRGRSEDSGINAQTTIPGSLSGAERSPAPATVITPLGRRMLAFPVHPRYARMLLAAQEHGCVYQACLVAALTQGRDLLLRNVDKHTAEFREDLLGDKASSDFWILMRAWNYASKNDYRLDACRKLGVHAVTARQVGPLFEQFLRIARDEGLDTQAREVKDEALQKCILIGFSDRVARRLDGGTLRCELVHGRRGVLARESVAGHSPLLVAAEVREVGQHGGDTNTILSLATVIEADWLGELFPEDVTRRLHVLFDSTSRRVLAGEQLQFRGLALAERRVEPPPADEAARLLAAEVLAGRLAISDWDHTVEQWILRLNLLVRWCPELALPPITDDDRRHLVEQLCHGAYGYKDIKDRPVKPLVQGWINESQRALLDKHAPERLALSNGRTPKVTYDAANPPHVALRIQELFDVTQTPKIAQGRVPVLVHILAPSMRPVQVTQDLAGFWREHYPKLKQELQRKYPKHEWR